MKSINTTYKNFFTALIVFAFLMGTVYLAYNDHTKTFNSGRNKRAQEILDSTCNIVESKIEESLKNIAIINNIISSSDSKDKGSFAGIIKSGLSSDSNIESALLFNSDNSETYYYSTSKTNFPKNILIEIFKEELVSKDKTISGPYFLGNEGKGITFLTQFATKNNDIYNSLTILKAEKMLKEVVNKNVYLKNASFSVTDIDDNKIFEQIYNNECLTFKSFIYLPESKFWIVESCMPVAKIHFGNHSDKPLFLASIAIVFIATLIIFFQLRSRDKIRIELKASEENLKLRDQIAEIFLVSSDQNLFDDILHLLKNEFKSSIGYFGYINRDQELVCPTFLNDVWSKCAMDDKVMIFPKESWGGIWGTSLKEKKLLIKNDNLIVPTGHLQLHNTICIPVIHGTRSIGHITLANKPFGYNDEDAKRLQSVAAHMAPMLSRWIEKTYAQEEENKYRSKLEELNKKLEKTVHEEMEKRQHQERLLFEQKKFIDMGQMVSAIAHQWRQPLNALGLNIQYIEELLEDKNIYLEEFSDMKQQSINLIKHMSNTIDDFRDFFSENKKKETFDIINTVYETLGLVSAQLTSAGINYSVKCGCKDNDFYVENDLSNIPECKTKFTSVYGNSGEFKQVILNLIENSKYAIIDRLNKKEIESGKISIELLSTPYRVDIKLSDNGGGVPDKVKDRIFDPYFTTKEEGDGTGIGLYMTKTIIEKNMKGRLKQVNISDGAEFSITLFPQEMKE